MAKQSKSAQYFDRYLEQELKNPEFKTEYERQLRAIKAVDELVNALDGLREANNLSKAEVARMIDKNPASIRRLLTASGNPEMKTVVAMADALNADVKIVPRKNASRKRAIATA